MRRLLLLLFALSLCLLAYGTAYHPDNAAFWLASGETTNQIIRLLLAGVLFVQFATHPPRNIYFRLLCGLIAVTSGIWVVQQSAAYHMMYLDALSIMGASVATAITALEFNYKPEQHRTSQHVFIS